MSSRKQAIAKNRLYYKLELPQWLFESVQLLYHIIKAENRLFLTQDNTYEFSFEVKISILSFFKDILMLRLVSIYYCNFHQDKDKNEPSEC